MNFIDQLIVVKVYPTRSSHSIPGSEYIDLINGDAKFYVTNSCSVEDMHGFLKHELGEYA